MDIYTLESLISIVLGLVAMLIPVVGLIFRIARLILHKQSEKGCRKSIFVFFSMLCCGASITVQVWSIRQCILVRDDLSAVLDTINVLSFVCIALLGITTLLNALYIICTRKSK